jgi:hypothetical protein
MSWGLSFTNLETRHCGNGCTLIDFNSTITALNSLVNDRHGLYLANGNAYVDGGVFQGNHILTQNDNADVSLAGEITILGGAPVITGAFIEGEGTNPPWSIIVDGIDAATRSYGSKIIGNTMTRSSNTAHTRGGILIRRSEESFIDNNYIYPTSVDGTGASVVSHVYLDDLSLNTKLGQNGWGGRRVVPGSLSTWYPKIINTSDLPQVPYPNATEDGGITTTNKRIRLNWLLPNASLTTNLVDAYAIVPGCLSNYHPIVNICYLTNITVMMPQGQSAGNLTIKLWIREADSGSLFEKASITTGPESGINTQMLSQHCYQTEILKGNALITVSTDASFAPTVSNEILICVELEETDNH